MSGLTDFHSSRYLNPWESFRGIQRTIELTTILYIVCGGGCRHAVFS